MKTYSIQDQYNDTNVWIVKVYDKCQVYYNQEVEGIKVNSRFQPTTKGWINKLLDIDLNERLTDEEQQELLDSEEPEEYMGQDGTLHTFDDDDYAVEQELQVDLDAVEQELQDQLDTLPF